MADQIDAYFARTEADIAPNTAHTYMPHCTLTGFFWDEPGSAQFYTDNLIAFYDSHPMAGANVQVIKLTQNEKWIGLEMKAPKIERWVAKWSAGAPSPTLAEKIRLKDWYHLSLAYGFTEPDYERLCQMTRMIDITTEVQWSLRFYERAAGNQWHLHWESDLL